jgi:hypothetical protein
MSNIALHTPDKTNFPNLALMKISAWHKLRGDSVEWFQPLMRQYYDRVYSSKVFTFTPKDNYLPTSAFRSRKGGIGYNKTNSLPDYIEHIMPDYSLYKSDFAQGFITRGCPNKCGWCIVPSKEGGIRPNADVFEFWDGQKETVLMDNNILAHEHGLEQLEKIASLKTRLDCNQGLDARLVNNDIAKVLSKVKWKVTRFACDHESQMPAVKNAIDLIRKYSGKKGSYFVYVLVKDIEDAHKRVEFLRSIGADPFAQPYRDFTNNIEPTKEQKRFARWVNHKAIFKTVKWEHYR